MMKVLALAGVMVFLCSPTPASDGDKKDEKKPAIQPVRISLTPAQSKTIEEIDQQFQRLQEEAQKQAQMLSARESGLLTAFVMGTRLEGKQYRLVKEKDGYAVEEVVPPGTDTQPPIPAPAATAAPVSVPGPAAKDSQQAAQPASAQPVPRDNAGPTRPKNDQ